MITQSTCFFLNGAEEVQSDLSRGSASVAEVPAVAHNLLSHGKTELTADVAGGEVVLDKLVTPFAEHTCHTSDVFDDLVA